MTVPTVLITVANRGPGLEPSRPYAADGRRVFTSRRNPRRADDNPGAVSLLAPARAVIGRLNLDDSGKFLSYDGPLIPR